MSDLLGNPDSFLQQGTERPAEDFSSAEDQSPDIPPAELDSVEDSQILNDLSLTLCSVRRN